MIYRLWVSDSPDKYGGRGKKNNEITVEARDHKEGISRLNALVSEKYGLPPMPSAPIRVRGRRRFDAIPLYPVGLRRGRR